MPVALYCEVRWREAIPHPPKADLRQARNVERACVDEKPHPSLFDN